MRYQGISGAREEMYFCAKCLSINLLRDGQWKWGEPHDQQVIRAREAMKKTTKKRRKR